MIRLLVVIILVLLPMNIFAQEWQLPGFMIYGSWPWDRSGKATDEARAMTLKKAGMNCVLADETQLDILQKVGLKGLIEHVPPEDVHGIMNHPALYGYYIMDEPLHNFQALKKIYDAYYEADPTKPGFINLISLGGDYLTSYMETVQPNILSYDYYQYWWGKEGHFTKLEQYAKAANDGEQPTD